VNVAPAVRNHVKWSVGGNTATSKVSDLQYIRVNLKIHNTATLPYLMVYTQAGSSRKYVVVSGNGSLVNGTVYSFYMNFNSYAREPATIGATNAALDYTVGSGSFANNETIASIAVETDSNATAGNVEFTLSSVVVGELNGEKEYGFEAAVPESYP
jgi:ActR/RegA family two-component response regulator